MVARKRHRELFKRLSYSFIEIIEKIQEAPGLPTITGLAEDMGIHVSTVWRRMRTLHEYNIEFSVDVNYQALGIKRVVAVSYKRIPIPYTDKKYLEFYALLIPKGTILQYIIPNTRVETLVDRLLEDHGDSIREITVYDHFYTPKPNLRIFYDVVKQQINPNWSYIYETSKALSYNRNFRRQRKVKYDAIDLFILEQLSSDPFISMREISQRLQSALSNREWRIDPLYSSVSYSRVRRHFLNHIIGRSLVTGIHVKLSPVAKESGIEMILEFKGVDDSHYLVAKAFTEHPYTIYSMASSNSGKGLVRIAVPNVHVRGLLDLMERFTENGYILDWTGYVIDRYNTSELSVSFKYFG